MMTILCECPYCGNEMKLPYKNDIVIRCDKCFNDFHYDGKLICGFVPDNRKPANVNKNNGVWNGNSSITYRYNDYEIEVK